MSKGNVPDVHQFDGTSSKGANIDDQWAACTDGQLPTGRIPFLEPGKTGQKYIYRKITFRKGDDAYGFVGQIQKNDDGRFPSLLPPNNTTQTTGQKSDYEILAPQSGKSPAWEEMGVGKLNFYGTGLLNAYVGWHCVEQKIGTIFLSNKIWKFKETQNGSIYDEGFQMLASE